ncbi:MAG: hypothetical protein L3K00_06010 [Thermoplasmata archaeon]|nr:hypothetical protein [Thermoplasmata archaeon]
MRRGRIVLPLLLAVLLLAPGWIAAAAPSPPTAPIASWGRFLTGISVPAVAPGASEVVAFTLQDPLGVPMSGILLTFGVYAFNAYPGNATGAVPGGGPVFSGNGVGAGSSVTIGVGNLTPNGTAFSSPGSISLIVAAPAGAPQGTYAIRTSVSFLAGGSAYLLESRGFFSASEWANATAPPGAPSTLNVSRLGVSGVLPETGLLVRSNPFPVALSLVLAGAVVLAALGGYWAVRRGPRSKSGANAGPPPNQAETAFGNNRSNDGD